MQSRMCQPRREKNEKKSEKKERGNMKEVLPVENLLRHEI